MFQEMKLTKVDMCASFDFEFRVREIASKVIIEHASKALFRRPQKIIRTLWQGATFKGDQAAQDWYQPCHQGVTKCRNLVQGLCLQILWLEFRSIDNEP
jgi:hypothetical protein